MALNKTTRGYLEAALDRLSGRLLDFPPEKCFWTRTAVRIPSRDGLELHADLYEPMGLPQGVAPSGTLLTLSPYGRSLLVALSMAHVYAARGYNVLFVSLRGTFGSGGTFVPGQDEEDDAVDVLAWMRQQPWYTGSFATMGASWSGWAQWALLKSSPPDCIASAICVGLHDIWDWQWSSGAYHLDRVGWSYLLAVQQQPGWIPVILQQRRIDKIANEASINLPLLKAIQTLLGETEPSCVTSAANPLPDAPYWQRKQHRQSIELVGTDMPVLLTSGWFDPFAQQTLQQYQRLYERGCQVELIIGPWDHNQAGMTKVGHEVFAFMERNVADREKQPSENSPVVLPRARIFIYGSNEWRTITDAWPPASKPLTVYLSDEKNIVAQPPSASVRPTAFTFDPSQPTPALGGPLLMSSNCQVDDSAYASRPDVLVFDSSPIQSSEGLEIIGAPQVTLAHSSDSPYADIWIRLSEVDVKGISHNIVEEFRVLTADEATGKCPVTLKLRLCAHRFLKGTRIRLIVAGGSWPAYARNLGTGEDRMNSSEMRQTTQTIAYASGVSQLVLPVTNGIM
ncbi:X-Pro dipeptidyl-peptidase domain-containing protein [Trichoderma chlorosporum]